MDSRTLTTIFLTSAEKVDLVPEDCKEISLQKKKKHDHIFVIENCLLQ